LKDKVRIYVLARELNLESKELIDLCQKAGIEVKNQLSSLDPDQRDVVEALVKKSHGKSAPPPAAPKMIVPGQAKPVPTLTAPPRQVPPRHVETRPEPAPEPAPVTVKEPALAGVAAVAAPVAAPPPRVTAPVLPAAPVEPPPAPVAVAPAPVVAAAPVASAPVAQTPPAAPVAAPGTTPALSPSSPPAVQSMPTRLAADFGKVRNLNAPPRGKPPTLTKAPPVLVKTSPPPVAPAAKPTAPVAPAPVPTPAATAAPAAPPPSAPPPVEPAPKTPERRSDRPERPRTPHVVAAIGRRRPPSPTRPPEKKVEEPAAQKPLMRLSPELLQSPSVNVKEVLNKIAEKAKQQEAEKLRKDHRPGTVEPAPMEEGEEGDDASRKRGGIPGREERHKKRSQRAKTRHDEEPGKIRLEEEEEAPVLPTLHRQHRGKPLPRPITQPRKGKVALIPPITVRSLSEVMGVRANDILRKLIERKQMVTINAELTVELAEEMALEFGQELEIKKPLDPEEQLITTLEAPSTPEDLQPRAPVVTIMGHVDHGKTSLLDRIRESNVVATEAGGITQHLRAWRVDHGGRPITFLDTPGHEAFTQMRARGANVTDIVVLVVAADDGVMPQTEEAISHAQAAGVPIIVAINKVDLPGANLNRTRQQLYGKGLIPDDMGGDTPFVETVSVKDRARGVTELLDMISLVAEMRELKGNPNRPARGTCLEARMSGDEGVSATVLVQDGTLRKGDVILCGTSFGRVRAMFNDLMQPIEEAGPSIPVRVMGLDEAPNADDKFHVIPDLAQARAMAEKRQERSRSSSPMKKSTFRLEDLNATKVTELKVIVKADVRGSIEAIIKELEKLKHEEVRIRILHTGVGAISEGDVQLALASPQDTTIVGFNVVPDNAAMALADANGIQIRQYDIIYKLTGDLQAALEGKLKPREEVIHLGRALVRETFKISRVGTVAGCYVTQGTIERSGRIRLIRDGVVIYPPPDRTATLDSLKRFKDDVREVREGFECGIKIANFDDIKVGDVIEAYRVEQVQRKL
jgi:translation initiation factor IF-2